MKYQIVRVIKEVQDFEEACLLAGLNRQPAFDEAPGELFWSNEKKVGILAVPEPGDDELTHAVADFVDLFDGGIYHSAEEYFAANPKPGDEYDSDIGEPELTLSDFDQTGIQTDNKEGSHYCRSGLNNEAGDREDAGTRDDSQSPPRARREHQSANALTLLSCRPA